MSFIRQGSLSFKCNLSPWHFVSARVSVKCRVLFLTLIYILNEIPLKQSHAQQEQHLLSCYTFQCANPRESVSVYQPTCLSLSCKNNFVFQVVPNNKRWVVPWKKHGRSEKQANVNLSEWPLHTFCIPALKPSTWKRINNWLTCFYPSYCSLKYDKITNSDSENESRYGANIGNDSYFTGLFKCGYELALFTSS